MVDSIGARVTQLIGALERRVPHRELAEQVGMTPDAFSRALNDKRAFASIELARLAELLDTDVYWLITGTPDPNRLVISARHDYDAETREHSVPSQDADKRILEDIHIAYRQVFREPAVPPALPETPAAVRNRLGDDFVLPFIDRIEQTLSVDVIRAAELKTAYSFSTAGRRVIAIPAKGNWFRENWDLAHELGHLVGREAEPAAHAFAADLLLPADLMRSVDWSTCTLGSAADFLWATGVSADALLLRLNTLLLPVRAELKSALSQPTQRLLRRHWSAASDQADKITWRMDNAAARRFPIALQEAHQSAIAAGQIRPAFLAWMLGVDEEWLEIGEPKPDPPADTIDELAVALGLISS